MCKCYFKMAFHFVKVLVDRNYQPPLLLSITDWETQPVMLSYYSNFLYLLNVFCAFLSTILTKVESTRQLILIWIILVELYNCLGCEGAKYENEKLNFTWNIFVFLHEYQMYPDLLYLQSDLHHDDSDWTDIPNDIPVWQLEMYNHVHDDLYHGCNQPKLGCRHKFYHSICSMFFYCFVIKECIYLSKSPQGFCAVMS